VPEEKKIVEVAAAEQQIELDEMRARRSAADDEAARAEPQKRVDAARPEVKRNEKGDRLRPDCAADPNDPRCGCR
jgi:hypothetical protein